MSENSKSDQFDAAQFDRWIIEAAQATITDADLLSLLTMAKYYCNPDRDKRLEASINSYCHIVRITREYEDVNVDLETSQRLLAKQARGEPFTDEEIRLLGKRSSIREASVNLWNICVWSETSFSDEQCGVLTQSLFEQAVAHGEGDITDRADFAVSARTPDQERKRRIASGISLVTEKHDWALIYSKMSPQEKADHERSAKQLRESGIFADLPSEEGEA